MTHVAANTGFNKPDFLDKKITIVWKNKLLRKIFLDIVGNTQFRLCKYLKRDFCKKLNSLVAKRYTDNEIYDDMFDWVHTYLKPRTRELVLYDNNKYRSTNRAEKIQELVHKYLNTEDKPKSNHELNVLDVGCAEGAITVMVGQYMNLDPEQVHGCDIENISDNNPYQNQFTFTHLSDPDSYKLPYADNSYHVVLALMSLHHIPNKEAMLAEIHRILKPGGLLVLREHHCINNGLSTVLDIVHGFYSMVWANPREMTTFNDYYARYTHAEHLTKILEKQHFLEKYNNHIPEYPRFFKGKIINPLSYYYGAYEKIPCEKEQKEITSHK